MSYELRTIGSRFVMSGPTSDKISEVRGRKAAWYMDLRFEELSEAEMHLCQE